MGFTFYIRLAIVIASALFIAWVVWLFNDWQKQKQDNERKDINYVKERLLDSLKIAFTQNSEKEIKATVESDPYLRKLVEEQNIKIRNIENIARQSLTYKDNDSRSQDISELAKGIKNKQRVSVKWSDSTKCLKVSGKIIYIPAMNDKESDTAIHVVDKREFNNEYTAIGYSRRKKFLGLRIGKKEYTAVVTNSCGETKTIIMNKVK